MRKFKKWAQPEIEHGKLTQWNWMVQHPEKLSLGIYADIGAFTYINAKFGVIIEDYVQIGSHCSIYSESTIDNKQGSVHIKKNARIGSHSVIMPGITVGANCIIGAFSFINKDVPDCALAYGVPIKIMRSISNEDKKKWGINNA